MHDKHTKMTRIIDPQSHNNPPLPASYHLTGLPNSQAFIYATWDVTPQFSITPNVQVASARWSTLSGNNNLYVKGGSFALVNFEAEYAFADNVDFQIGARILFDQNYQL